MQTIVKRYARYSIEPDAAIGIVLCGVAAALAYALSRLVGGPEMIYALLVGYGLQSTGVAGLGRSGVCFSAKTLLRLGIGLLGAGVTFQKIALLGFGTVLLTIAGVIVALIAGMIAARIMGLDREAGLLLGGAVAICGASAALAIASVLPRSERSEANTLVAIIGVTALSTIAMLTYPIVTAMLQLSERSAGIFIGASIHDVAQVVGAGYMISDVAGETSTVVKLLRVACLAPLIILVSLLIRRSRIEPPSSPPSFLPWYLCLFLALSTAASCQLIPMALIDPIGKCARFMLVMAISALAMEASLKTIASVGARPLAVLVIATVVLAAFALGNLLLFADFFS